MNYDNFFLSSHTIVIVYNIIVPCKMNCYVLSDVKYYLGSIQSNYIVYNIKYIALELCNNISCVILSYVYDGI